MTQKQKLEVSKLAYTRVLLQLKRYKDKDITLGELLFDIEVTAKTEYKRLTGLDY